MATAKKVNKPTTKQKIETAQIRKGLADARVKNDKWLGAYAEYTGPQERAIKAKNVRKAVDASKTAGRAKNVEMKLKKAAAKKMK